MEQGTGNEPRTPQTPAPPPQASLPATGSTPPDTWNMLCHLAALSGLVTGFGAIVGPLVVWLIKKDEIPSVDRHGKEAINFNISATIYFIGAMVVAIPLMFLFIGFLIPPALMIAWLIFVIKASVDASNGREVTYPLTIRFLK